MQILSLSLFNFLHVQYFDFPYYQIKKKNKIKKRIITNNQL